MRMLFATLLAASMAPAAHVPTRPIADVPALGAPVHRGDFHYARPLGTIARGLTLLALDADVLARSSALRDVRIVDDHDNQVPYLVDPGDQTVALYLIIPPRTVDGSRSIYRIAIPYDALPSGSKLELTTSARVFERNVTLRRPVDESRGREAETVDVQTWRSSDPNAAPPPLTFAMSCGCGKAIEIVIDEGDNAPLPLSGARLTMPAFSLRFVSPGATLTLLYGNAAIDAPHYDLALVASQLLREPAREIELSPVAIETAAQPHMEKKIFWIVIVVAIVVLLFTLVRLLAGGISAKSG